MQEHAGGIVLRLRVVVKILQFRWLHGVIIGEMVKEVDFRLFGEAAGGVVIQTDDDFSPTAFGNAGNAPTLDECRQFVPVRIGATVGGIRQDIEEEKGSHKHDTDQDPKVARLAIRATLALLRRFSRMTSWPLRRWRGWWCFGIQVFHVTIIHFPGASVARSSARRNDGQSATT